jgi:hypothetical protein
LNFLLFALAVVGMTHILVDPATIVKPFRDLISNVYWLDKLFSCYQCCGTWVGFFFGYLLISKDIPTVFACGMAGSFLSTLSASFLNYLEARTLVDLEENENEND